MVPTPYDIVSNANFMLITQLFAHQWWVMSTITFEFKETCMILNQTIFLLIASALCTWPFPEFLQYDHNLVISSQTVVLMHGGMKNADNIFKCIFEGWFWYFHWNFDINLFPSGPINNKSTLAWVVAWHQTRHKPLPVIWLNTGSRNGLFTDGTKPLHELVLISH